MPLFFIETWTFAIFCDEILDLIETLFQLVSSDKALAEKGLVLPHYSQVAVHIQVVHSHLLTL